MITEKIKYTDLNGNEHEETCYFHLNKIERTRFATKYPGGISDWAQKQAEDGQAGAILSALEEIVQMAYGKRSDDGSSFVKNAEETAKFTNSEAYSELITGFLELDEQDNPTKLMKFLQGVVGINA